MSGSPNAAPPNPSPLRTNPVQTNSIATRKSWVRLKSARILVTYHFHLSLFPNSSNKNWLSIYRFTLNSPSLWLFPIKSINSKHEYRISKQIPMTKYRKTILIPNNFRFFFAHPVHAFLNTPMPAGWPRRGAFLMKAGLV